MALEKISPDLNLITFADKTPVGHHERRFNAPTTSEVAVIHRRKYGHPDLFIAFTCNPA
jgi:hypothetical protein